MCGDRRKTSVEWPAAVDDRLRHLVRLAEGAADLQTTSASELLAALIWAQPVDGARLAAMITAYRQTGRDTMEAGGSSELDLPQPPRRGRPRRKWIKNNPRAGDAAHEPRASTTAKRAQRPTANRISADPPHTEAGTVASWATSPATRRSMQANRRRDTGPELAIRRLVHARGLRYRVDARPLPSARHTADMIFTRARVAVFIDGCWWHGCVEHYRPPTSNAGYWAAKVARNRERDRLADEALGAVGWAVVRVWEHEPPDTAARRIEATVRDRTELTKDKADMPPH